MFDLSELASQANQFKNDLAKLDNMSADEIGLKLDELNKGLESAEKILDELEIEDNALRMKVLELTQQRAPLKEKTIRAKALIREIKKFKETGIRKFWKAREIG